MIGSVDPVNHLLPDGAVESGFSLHSSAAWTMLTPIENVTAAGTPRKRAYQSMFHHFIPAPHFHFPRTKKQCRIKALIRHECAHNAQFLTSYPQIYPQGSIRGVGWGTDLIPKQNCALKRTFSNSNFDQEPAIFSLVGREHANIGMAIAFSHRAHDVSC